MISEEVSDPDYGTVRFRESRDLKDCLFITPEMNDEDIDPFNIGWVQPVVMNNLDGFRFIVFDFSRLKNVSSTSALLMTEIARTVHAQLGELILTGLTSTMREIFDLFGVSSVAVISDDTAHAVSLLSDPVEMKRHRAFAAQKRQVPPYTQNAGNYKFPTESKQDTPRKSDVPPREVDLESWQELRSTLQQLDIILDHLPDGTIRNFARSEHFEIYKSIFKILEISDSPDLENEVLHPGKTMQVSGLLQEDLKDVLPYIDSLFVKLPYRDAWRFRMSELSTQWKRVLKTFGTDTPAGDRQT